MIDQVGDLLATAGVTWPVETAQFEDGVVTVCLDVPVDVLQADDGYGAEALQQAVRRALTPIDWRVLHVQAPDPESWQVSPTFELFVCNLAPFLKWRRSPHL